MYLDDQSDVTNQNFVLKVVDDVPNILDDPLDNSTKTLSVYVIEPTICLDDPPRNIVKGDVPNSTHVSDDPPFDAVKPAGDVPEPSKVSEDPPHEEEQEYDVNVEMVFNEDDATITTFLKSISQFKFLQSSSSNPQVELDLQLSSDKMEVSVNHDDEDGNGDDEDKEK